MKRAALSLCLILCLFSFLSSAYAWTITKELQAEVKQKQAALKANPHDPQAHFDLAITYAYTNQIEAGWSELKKVNEMDPNFEKVALPKYIKLVNADPGNWKIRFRLAFAYYFNGQKSEAVRELKNVLISDPYNVFAYGYIALIEGEQDHVDEALKSVKQGLKIDRQVAALHLLLSQAYYKKGDNWKGFLEAAETIRLKALGY